MWYHKTIGHKNCPIIDTWWQTETGGILISPLPGAIPTKPGSATLPFFGVLPVIVDPEKGTPIEGNGVSGALCLASPWPGNAHRAATEDRSHRPQRRGGRSCRDIRRGGRATGWAR